MLWMAQQPMFNHLSNIGEYYKLILGIVSMSGGEYFVMRKNEDPNDAKDYAFSRCEKLQEIEDACYKRPP